MVSPPSLVGVHTSYLGLSEGTALTVSTAEGDQSTRNLRAALNDPVRTPSVIGTFRTIVFSAVHYLSSTRHRNQALCDVLSW